MTFCNLCAHYHINQNGSVICFYPHYKKPVGNSLRIIVKDKCPIYEGGGVSSGINYANLDDRMVGVCADCRAPLTNKGAVRCKRCSHNYQQRKYAKSYRAIKRNRKPQGSNG